MFISRLFSRCNNWLENVDRYALQRIVFYKSLFIATLMVWVYWFFKPMSFSGFISPILLASLYEMPSLVSVKEKDRAFLFIFAAFITGSISFYLIYTFRFMFLYYAIAFLAALFFLFQRFIPKLRNISIFIITLSTLYLTTKPSANFQIVYNFFISSMLAILTLFVGLKCFPNHYIFIWCRGIQHFIECLEIRIESTLNQSSPQQTMPSDTAISIIAASKRMVPKKYLIHTGKMAMNLRNIQFAFYNRDEEERDNEFWFAVLTQLQLIRSSMAHKKICSNANITTTPETKLQQLVHRYLQQTTLHWNKLCLALES